MKGSAGRTSVCDVSDFGDKWAQEFVESLGDTPITGQIQPSQVRFAQATGAT